MSSKSSQGLKPFISILILIGTLFTVVFLQMEQRRIGYAILKLTRDQRAVVETKRVKTIQLAKVTRPQHIEKMAQTQLTMKKISAKQIIHLTSAGTPN